MKILIGCESSGRAREAFRHLGHDAISCDLLPSDDGSAHHVIGDVRDLLDAQAWDLAVFFPPCTYLCNSGVRWLWRGGSSRSGARDVDRWARMVEGAEFFATLQATRIPRVAIENPIMHEHARALVQAWPRQIVQPWMFGTGEIKATVLHLKNLRPLTPTNIVDGRRPRVHHESPAPDRWKKRSITDLGLAAAMADQWGGRA